MELGAFSISLAVKDLPSSKAFYEKLGFETLGGDADAGYLILKNNDHIIGLFQGMFEQNIITFNPGWDQSGNNVDSFTDIREIQESLINQGVELATRVDDNTTGPGSITLADPDGNVILIDQHR